MSASATTPAAVVGRSIVAGERTKSDPSAPLDTVFRAIDPSRGVEVDPPMHAASDRDVDRACRAAWEAFAEIQSRAGQDRARLLDRIGLNLLELGDGLLELASTETGLPVMRLAAERDRTVNTLRIFANLIMAGEWVRAAIDRGDANRRPVPKPDVRRMLRPLGPVAVFGASNFPLAYSTAGGDTASALAAGCPVIVKGHPSHPGTGELVAGAVAEAVARENFPPGTFSFLHAGGSRERTIGELLVRHPCVRAVGFTGSFEGGTALAALAAKRGDPIPVYAEMGSTNPIFVLPQAVELQPAFIAERLFASITNSNGQMCTCPGLVFLHRSDGAEALLKALAGHMNQSQPQVMLSPRIRAGFVVRTEEILGADGIEVRAGSPAAGHRTREGAAEAGAPVYCSPVLFRTTLCAFRANPTLHRECFGPASIVVICDDEQEMVAAASLIQGSLTGTIWAGAHDVHLAGQVQAVLEQRVGRIIYNGVPTGVEVCAAMVHGGPFPATNAPHTTAVGPFAIERWCRPVCYQNTPDSLLPPELKDANPGEILRLVDGARTREPIER